MRNWTEGKWQGITRLAVNSGVSSKLFSKQNTRNTQPNTPLSLFDRSSSSLSVSIELFRDMLPGKRKGKWGFLRCFEQWGFQMPRPDGAAFRSSHSSEPRH
jgi:hypothetical protein